MSQYCVEKNIELCAVHTSGITLLCIYISPMGDFEKVLKMLSLTLQKLYKPRSEILLCGDLIAIIC